MSEESELVKPLASLLRAVGALDIHLEGATTVAAAATARLQRINAATAVAAAKAAGNRNRQLLELQQRAAQLAKHLSRKAEQQV